MTPRMNRGDAKVEAFAKGNWGEEGGCGALVLGIARDGGGSAQGLLVGGRRQILKLFLEILLRAPGAACRLMALAVVAVSTAGQRPRLQPKRQQSGRLRVLFSLLSLLNLFRILSSLAPWAL